MKSRKLLALVLALIMLVSVPVGVLAETLEVKDPEAQEVEAVLRDQEEEGDKEDPKPIARLQELSIYVIDDEGNEEEVQTRPQFTPDRFYNLYLDLPKNTKRIKVVAIPAGAVTPNIRMRKQYDTKTIDAYTKVFDWDYYIKEEPKNDYVKGFGLGNLVIESNPDTGEGKYIIEVKVEGYRPPEIRGVKNRIYKRNQVITKAEVMDGITAWDEVDKDLSDELNIISGWRFDYVNDNKDILLTKYTTPEGQPITLIYEVVNSNGLRSRAIQQISIVDEIKDQSPPIFNGIKSKIFYTGQEITRDLLLEGISAIDDFDGDLSSEIKVEGPVGFVADKEGDIIYTYKVADKAGNETVQTINHSIKEKDNVLRKINKILPIMARSYYSTGEDWPAVALAIYGKADMIHLPTLLTQAQGVIAKNPIKATEYERIAVSLTAAGFDVTELPTRDGKTINLIEKIANHEPMGTINDYIWALIAYDSGKYDVPEGAKWTRQALIDYIVNAERRHGGWSLDGNKSGGLNIDITAMAISALAPYRDQGKVEEVLQRAIGVLSSSKTSDMGYGWETIKVQDKSGFYSYKTVETSESASMVIMALSSMGIDPHTDSRFSRNGKSTLTNLMSFYSGHGSFKHVNVITNDYFPEPNSMATEQAFRALATYIRSMDAGFEPIHIYQFRDFSKINQEDPDQPDLPGQPEEPEIPDDENKSDTPIDPGTIVTLNELKILSLPNKTSYEQGEAPSLEGLKVQAKYSDGTKKLIPVKDLQVYGFSTDTWGTDKRVLVSYGGMVTTFNINVRQPKVASHEASIYVADPQGRTYFRPKKIAITPGVDTAFSLLQKTGLNYKYNFNPSYEGVYVSSIEGLAEFDRGTQSGWMYSVNGDFPSYSSSLYKLKDGDKVEWLYTRDLGKDLGAPIAENPDAEEFYLEITAGPGGKTLPQGKHKIKRGQDLTVKIQPDQGYEVEDVKVNGISQGIIDSYTFKEVYKDGSLQVTFKKKGPEEDGEPQGQDPEGKMTDIQGHWGEEAIKYSLDQGYFIGKSETSFAPEDPLTRGEWVTVLGRKVQAKLGEENKFTDINGDEFFAPYASWALEQGLVQGYPDKTFRPYREISREEMAIMLIAFAKQDKLNKVRDMSFKDKDSISPWAKDQVQLLGQAGLVEGMEDGTFGPQKNLTRAEAAQVLYNLDKK